MKRFLFKLMLFVLLLALILLSTFYLADGGFDPYYLRFTSDQQSSLILGSSRAAHGLQPAVINQRLGRSDCYNYAFSMTHSPYGPTYLKSIQRKIKAGSTAIFILAVDPWSLASKWVLKDDASYFDESELALGKIQNVHQKPNFNYLLKCPGNPYYKIFLKSRTMFLHNDGWLEVNIDMDSMASSQRLAEKIKYYRENYLPNYKFSSLRVSYLDSTIQFLKKYGNVYLVRLPVHPKILQFDEQLSPDFTKRMEKLSTDRQVPYLDLSAYGAEFEYIDGNHLYKSSGAKISGLIADWIKTTASIKH